MVFYPLIYRLMSRVLIIMRLDSELLSDRTSNRNSDNGDPLYGIIIAASCKSRSPATSRNLPGIGVCNYDGLNAYFRVERQPRSRWSLELNPNLNPMYP